MRNVQARSNPADAISSGVCNVHARAGASPMCLCLGSRLPKRSLRLLVVWHSPNVLLKTDDIEGILA